MSFEGYIKWFLRHGLYLFRIVPYDKRPLANHYWANTLEHNAEPCLTFNDALAWILKSGNIAVRADNLAIFDFDHRVNGTVSATLSFYRKFGTVVSFTPHGYHVWFDRSNIDEDDKLQSKFESKFGVKMNGTKDDIRSGNGYVLVPPSRISYSDGTIKSYYFLDYQDVMTGELRIGAL